MSTSASEMADKQDQKSGDDSVNVQAGGNVSFGMSYSETKDLAQVVARQEARVEMERRMQEIADAVYYRLQKEKPAEARAAVSSPDFQLALFDAQKGYARTGDATLRDMLLNLLINRVGADDRPLVHAVLAEALVTAPKLLPRHFDLLTAIFVFRHSKMNDITSREQLRAFLARFLVPFIDDWPASDPTFEYLQYTGCGSVSAIEATTARLMRETYPQPFPGPIDDNDVNSFLESVNPKMVAFVNSWNKSLASRFVMTAVGKAIAHANFERRTRSHADLNSWVN